ncbi:MAG: sensor domain-containing diguanylate cyclase [Anaerolineales bacterium]|nr:sensor domain-containing diguanylate cyclase [Anaerolineales bacterium]
MNANKDTFDSSSFPEPGQKQSFPGPEWAQQEALVPEVPTDSDIQSKPDSPVLLADSALQRFSSLDDLILILDRDGLILEVNKPALKQLDYTLTELAGTFISCLYPADKTERVNSRLRAMSLQNSASFIEPVRTKDGFLVPVETRLSWGKWQEEDVLFWVSRGIHAVESSDREVRAHATEFFETVYSTAAVPIVFFDLDGKILQMNQAFEELIEGSREELLQNQFQNFLPQEDILLHKQRIQQIISGNTSHSQQYEAQICSNSATIHVNCLLLMIRGQNGKPLYFINHMQNVTQQKKYEEQLQYLATHDPLTDLPNRTMLQDRFQHAVSIAKRHGKLIGLVCLDLDDFKLINDTYGHEIGDRLLINIAGKLSSAIRESDTIARIGGDEFVILLEGIVNSRDALKVLEKTLTMVSEPVLIDDHLLAVSASAGISTFPFDGDTLAQLLRVADFAMYQAKEMGSGRIGLPDFLTTSEQLSLFNLSELEEPEQDPESGLSLTSG